MTDQRQRFADRYFETLNATQSAIYAGYSEQSAKSQASQLLDDEEIQSYLTKLKSDLQEKSGINKQRIIDEYAKIAFFDIREIYDVDGGLINIRQFDDNSAGAVSGIKVSEEWGEDDEGRKIVTGIVKEVKLNDKLRALQDLGKHLGIFEKDNTQKTTSLVTIFKLPDNGRS